MKRTHETFVNELNEINDNIVVVGKYKNVKTDVLVKCKIDGHEWMAHPQNLLNGHGCGVCSGRIAMKGYNDINTTNPELSVYLKNYEDGYSVSHGSHKYIMCKCPDCGHEKSVQVKSLYSQGFSCDICGDYISYPNKYIRGLLRQISNLHFICEFRPEWANGSQYDCYFEFDDKKYVIEMDGAFHYKDNSISKMPVEHQIKIDKQKDLYAKNNNCIMIRIDCQKSDPEYIKQNIQKSVLNNIFDLSMINWEYCNQIATSNYIKLACEIYEKNKYEYGFSDIAKMVNVHCSTLTRYLDRGRKLGWCNTSVDEVHKLSRLHVKMPNSKKVRAYYKSKFFGDYPSMNRCYNSLIDLGFMIDKMTISRAIKYKNGVWKDFVFEFI